MKGRSINFTIFVWVVAAAACGETAKLERLDAPAGSVSSDSGPIDTSEFDSIGALADTGAADLTVRESLMRSCRAACDVFTQRGCGRILTLDECSQICLAGGEACPVETEMFVLCTASFSPADLVCDPIRQVALVPPGTCVPEEAAVTRCQLSGSLMSQ